MPATICLLSFPSLLFVFLFLPATKLSAQLASFNRHLPAMIPSAEAVRPGIEKAINKLQQPQPILKAKARAK